MNLSARLVAALLVALSLVTGCAGAPAQPAPTANAGAGAAPANPAPSGPSQGGDAAPGGAPAASAAPPSLGSVRAAYAIASVGMTPLWLADELGLWKQHGLDVELMLISGTPASAAALIAGEVQFVHIAGESAFGVQAQEPDVVGIANYSVKAAQQFVTRPNITRPEDLRGKRIGAFTIGDGVYAQWRKALLYWGVDPDHEVTWISVGGGNQGAFIAGLAADSIDAAMLLPPNDLPALKNGARSLAKLSDLPLPSPGLPTYVMRRTLSERRPQAEAYLKGVMDGVRVFERDPQLAKEVLGRRTGISDPEAINAAYAGYQGGNFTDRPFIDFARMEASLTELAVENPEVQKVQLERAFDNSVLQALEGQGYFAQ
ncbi:MAG TPA: ABC transporter substrate-binding protein [Chloroflexota bacterium]|nr:ABC transporter substrate-binding protein [Chloroflexota bacterium]